jgi:aspartyl-tRNA(Asn)/glutamyl-tRNA(Gln) amidotransferase subunit A
VEDAALVWAVLTGRNAGSFGTDIREAAGRRRSFSLTRLIGYFDSPVAPEIRAPFERALAVLSGAGADIGGSQISRAPGIMDAYVSIVLSEGAAWHAPYLDNRAGDYTPAVRDRFLAGRAIPAVKYQAARAFCAELRDEVDRLLEHSDALVLPTLPIVAPGLGASEITIDPVLGDRTPVRGAMLKHTQPFNMTGHPAISLPLPAPGLPAGLQLVGRRGETAALLALAARCERIIAHA